jgi:hypothetical protein
MIVLIGSNLICPFRSFRGPDFLRFLIAIPGPTMAPVQEPFIAHAPYNPLGDTAGKAGDKTAYA